MRLATLNTYWGERLAARVGDRIVDLAAAHAARLEAERRLRRDRAVRLAQLEVPPLINDFLLAGSAAWTRARGTIEWAATALAADPDRLTGAVWSLDRAPIGPVVPRPTKLWCMGANYMQHRIEMAARDNREAQQEPGGQGFIKSPSSIVGPTDDIVLPPESNHVDFEMELAVVIGTGGRRISQERAFEHIFGYTVFNDVSSRDIARMDNNRMDRGKGFDTFGVMGGWLVTADEVPDPHDLRVTMRQNGELRQDASTEDMVSNIPRIIWWLSQAMTLEPGDVISTGSPSGVAPIKPGDLLEGEVEGIGTLRNHVVEERPG
jgi:2-keto-4-pentenoate hydratase/2-oxohepta-3-ene-1,7-dioic acid hydratase in catechol pathway